MQLSNLVARCLRFAAIVGVVVWLVNGNAANGDDPGVAQADYWRNQLSGLRARAQTDLVRRYIELQQVRSSGLTNRAAYVERIIRALETELATLERLGEGIHRSLNIWLSPAPSDVPVSDYSDVL